MSRFCSSVPYKLGVVPGHKSGSRQSGLTNSVSFDNYHRIKPTTSRPAPTTLRKKTIAETSKGGIRGTSDGARAERGACTHHGGPRLRLVGMRARGEVIWGFNRQKICSNSSKRAYHCLSRGVVREIPVYTNQRRATVECRHNKEVSMRALIAGLGLASMLATGTAAAQLAPFNEVGVTMGHWHFASRDVEANKKIFVTMGGTPITG